MGCQMVSPAGLWRRRTLLDLGVAQQKANRKWLKEQRAKIIKPS
jgi:hypothetical protein